MPQPRGPCDRGQTSRGPLESISWLKIVVQIGSLIITRIHGSGARRLARTLGLFNCPFRDVYPRPATSTSSGLKATPWRGEVEIRPNQGAAHPLQSLSMP